MRVLKGWRGSLELFLPKNFKLFFLVTLKTIARTYFIWILRFWWLFVVLALFDPNLWAILFSGINKIIYTVFFILHFITMMFLIFTLFLSVRSSVKRKTLDYFWDYRIHLLRGIWFTLIIIAVCPLLEIIRLLYQSVHVLYTVHLLSELLFFIPFAVFFGLFYLDSKGKSEDVFYSLRRSVKMVIFNVPVFLIISLLKPPLTGEWAFKLGYTNLALFVPYFGIMLMPVFVSFMNNFYVKRLHDQFNIYFEE